MRARKNLSRVPSKADARLTALARSRGVVVADESALQEEERRGVAPYQATPEGLVAEDYRHLLVSGQRSFAGVAQGAAFYDPVYDEAVVLTTDGKNVLVEIGTLHLADVLGSKRKRVQADSVRYAADAYGLNARVVSRWLVSKIKAGAELGLAEGIDSLSYRGLLPLKPDAIWRELAQHGVVQPWGIGIVPGGGVQ